MTSSTPGGGPSGAAARCEQPMDGPAPSVAAAAPMSRPPLSTISLQCALLSLPASHTARPSSPSSRTAFVSARAQHPSHTGDRRSTPPSGANRGEPWLRLGPEADAPGLIRGDLRHALDASRAA